MADVYEQHRAAFAQVSAYVVIKDAGNGPERVATIAFKFPRDGAGRLWVYVHWLGTEMVRGYASGYGYDKRTAACANAAKKINRGIPGIHQDRLAFINALEKDSGTYWDRQLEDAGFTVLSAV